MSTISLRVSDDESKMIREYAKVNGMSLTQFIKDLVLDKIEEELNLDEERILQAKERINREKAYDHTEVWERLGV